MSANIDINKDLCIGCGKCMFMCPRRILFLNQNTNKCEVSEQSKCDKLRGCERVCPTKAIRIL
ncbi:MAG: 4Fe-4S binding protein [Endomicrobiales bacterium]|nr:4Fe-4S binding protein [Endomicrobiales bacterium]